MENYISFIKHLGTIVNGDRIFANPECIAQAEHIMNHEFNILGSGWVHNFYGMKAPGFEGHNHSDLSITYEKVKNTVPVWYKSQQDIFAGLIAQYNNDYVPVDWQIDIKSGGRTDIVHISEIKFGVVEGLDVKVTSDLSRGYHLVVLAKAWKQTGDIRYRNEIICQVLDWMTVSPPEYGAGWRANMNVAIRAANWLVACSIISGSFDPENENDRKFMDIFYDSLIIHRRYITGYLEFTELPTSLHPNHYIANLSGLLVLCSFLKKFDDEANPWEKMAVRELKLTAVWQTNSDGVNFEGTTMYHAFVLEMIAYAAIISARLNGKTDSATVRGWLEEKFGHDVCLLLNKMFAAQCGLMMPDGRLPVVGDADSGRFLYLESVGYHDADRSFLCGVGAKLFDDADLLFNGQKEDDFESAFILFNDMKNFEMPKKDAPGSKAFPQSGFYIIKNENIYSFINCSPIGTDGMGSHSHNDRLAITLNVKGEDIIIDPGVYAYTASKKYRDLYRNAQAHSTVWVDDKQPNRLNPPGCWWGYHDDTRCKCLLWETSKDSAVFAGEHYGYNRLDIPVTHRRRVEATKDMLKIEDGFLKAKGYGDDMSIDYSFTLAPDISVSIEGNIVSITKKDISIKAVTQFGKWEKAEGWYAPMYGANVKTISLRIHFDRFIYGNEITFEF